MRVVFDHIMAEWRENHSLEELAALVNLTPSRLEHLFKLGVRCPIREVVRRRRLQEAAHLLVATYKRVSEISYFVGFSDISNFNHAFRRQFGVSPGQYRRERQRL
ncbi:MAG: helix-turn-helix transcriptional regulator [Thermoanaerobaculia bacterium]